MHVAYQIKRNYETNVKRSWLGFSEL